MVQPSENPRTASGDPRRDQLRAALACAARGWAVFPLLPDSKAPAVRGWEQRASTEPDRLTRCWTTGAFNIGLATGPSGLMVLDLDMPKGDENPDATGDRDLRSLTAEAGHDITDTFTVLTGRGGFHRYHLALAEGGELRNSAGRLAPHIDTRAAGGYVVAPGSVVGGDPYVVLDIRPPVPLPGWSSDRLRPTPVPVSRPVTVTLRPSTGNRRRDAYLRSAVAREVQRVMDAPAGQRNHALFAAAVALGQLVAGGALTDEEVRDALDHAAAVPVGRDGFTTTEAHRTIGSRLRVGARRPRRLPGEAA